MVLNHKFEIVSTDFAIIFKANYKYDYGNLDKQSSTTQKKSEMVKMILDMINENKDITLQELANLLGENS